MAESHAKVEHPRRADQGEAQGIPIGFRLLNYVDNLLSSSATSNRLKRKSSPSRTQIGVFDSHQS